MDSFLQRHVSLDETTLRYANLNPSVRRFFIIKVAKDLNLVFPSSSATAITIRSMHLAADGSDSAWKTMKALGVAFTFAGGLRILSQYALGLLWVSDFYYECISMLIFCRIGISSHGWSPVAFFRIQH